MVIRFDGRNPRAETWLTRNSSRLIVEIVEDQRRAVRQAILEGQAQGKNPRNTALDIIGRYDRAKKRRTGGIIGLTSQQAGFVSSARAELSDPRTMSAYLRRGRRDKRYDRTVAKAIREGKRLKQADVDKIAGRYADRLLVYRGEVIARTETQTAVHAGNREGYQQLIDTGAVTAQQVRKVWNATLDRRTRDNHVVLHGTSIGFNEPFTSPTGAQLQHPGDTSLGATGEDTIQCRCWMETRIDFLSNTS